MPTQQTFTSPPSLGYWAYLSCTPKAKEPFEFLRAILKKKGSALKEVPLSDYELAVALEALVSQTQTQVFLTKSIRMLLERKEVREAIRKAKTEGSACEKWTWRKFMEKNKSIFWANTITTLLTKQIDYELAKYKDDISSPSPLL